MSNPAEPDSGGLQPPWRRARLGLLAGLTLVLASLPWYVSYDRRTVLGVWSESFALALAGFTGLWLLGLWFCVARWRSGKRASPAATASDLAVLVWGAGYLASTLDERTNAARILDVNFLGSVAPPAVALEWVALVLAVAAMALWIAPRLHPRLQNPALALATIAAVGVLGEGIARGKALIAPAVASFPTYSLAQWYRRYVRFNQDGFRDSDHAQEPAPGVRRLLIVGDSYGFGWGIRDVNDRFGEQLGTLLRQGTGGSWEVISAARPDQHTRQEIEFLRRALVYRPDVILLLYIFNDIDYLSGEFGFRPLTVRNVISESPRTLRDRLHPLRVVYWNSYAFQEVHGRLRMVRWRRARGGGAGAPGRLAAYDHPPVLDAHLLDLARFVELGRSGGGLVAIVPFDPLMTLAPESLDLYRRFVERAEGAGLPVWSLADAFRPHSLSELSVSAVDRHPSELANRLAALAIYPRLAEQLGQGSPPP